jgi:glycerol-3-phosphate acyltransferase PlsX
VRTKRDSSMRVASRLVRDGCAQAMVSAGNTGAVMATAKMVQGVVPGVVRPALVGIFPTMEKKPVVLVDVGANVDCDPKLLAQFAVMAELYSRKVLHTPNPRVGILSIGEEEHKGNDLTRATWQLLNSLNINFIGNVEGGDIYAGEVDVIVCDGFIGNVALKVSEGLVDMFKKLLREALEGSISGKIGYALSKGAFAEFKKRLDYSEYGGAPLLGVRGGCIICHGRSNANAINNAIRVAAEFSAGKVNEGIEEVLRPAKAGD